MGGWKTSSIFLKVSSIVLCCSLILFVVGFCTVAWMGISTTVSSYHYGLWKELDCTFHICIETKWSAMMSKGMLVIFLVFCLSWNVKLRYFAWRKYSRKRTIGKTRLSLNKNTYMFIKLWWDERIFHLSDLYIISWVIRSSYIYALIISVFFFFFFFFILTFHVLSFLSHTNWTRLVKLKEREFTINILFNYIKWSNWFKRSFC